MLDIETLILSAADDTSSSAAVSEARRAFEVCNACRYCEGYCAVFPAMTLRRSFATADINYLANLCHGCHGCYYSCQYAPPHEFGINVPKALAEVRQETYAQFAWPRALSTAFERNGLVIALMMAVSICAVFFAAIYLQGLDRLTHVYTDAPDQGFYSVIPYKVMVSVASLVFAFALTAIGIGFARFWRSIADQAHPLNARSVFTGLRDAATLRYLGGGGHGCNDTDETFSAARRVLHHVMAYGFLFCFASTSIATIYDHCFGRQAPYPFLSIPVVLGLLGGVGLTAGCVGLLWLKMKADRAPLSPMLLSGDVGLLMMLLLVAVSGLLLLAMRTGNGMGIALVVHLGLVLAFFLTMPYSRFVHGLYRLAALVRFAAEKPQ